MFVSDGEKAVLYLTVAKHRPSAARGNADTDRAWKRVAKDVLNATALNMMTSKGAHQSER